MDKYNDNSVAPIIAFDFDKTLCMGNSYPNPSNGTLRPYAREVCNLLTDIGCKVVIWTSRDISVDQDTFTVHDDLTPMIRWLLHTADIRYSAINRSVQFAPFKYNPRKIYAHLYVDDHAFGWRETPTIMLDVLAHILHDILGIRDQIVNDITGDIMRGEDPPYVGFLREVVSKWGT